MLRGLVIAFLVINNLLKQPETIPYDYVPSIEEYQSPTEWEAQKMRITCYVSSPNAHTASGQVVHYGGCAGRRADIGKTAYIYTLDRELIGIFEINDCGGNYQLRNGTALDIWQPSMNDAWNWVGKYGDYCYVIIVDSEG